MHNLDTDTYVSIRLQTSRSLTVIISSSLTAQAAVATLSSPPPFTLSIDRKVSQTSTASFAVTSGRYRLGAWGIDEADPVSTSTFALGLDSDNGWSIEWTQSVFAAQLSASWSRAFYGSRLRVGGNLTSRGAFSTFISGDARLSSSVRGGLTVDLSAVGMLTVKLRCASSSTSLSGALTNKGLQMLAPRPPPYCAGRHILGA